MTHATSQRTTTPPTAATCVGSGQFCYQVDAAWAKLPPGFAMGEVVGIAVDSRDRALVFHRGPSPVIVFDRGGNFLNSWGEGEFTRPHGILIGPDDAVYCTDDLGHAVRKFTLDGKLLLTLGTPGHPSDTGADSFDYRNIRQVAGPFNLPTNVALGLDGTIYAADGYCNARVHRFDPAGRLLDSWGGPGDGPGQFHVVHGVTVDAEGLVYICDRENSRVQVFDATGKFLDQWPDLARPCQICFDADQNAYVAELGYRAGMYPGNVPPNPNATGGRVSVFDRRRKLLARWGGGEDPTAPGDFFAPHGICVDSRGDIYVGEVVKSAAAFQGLTPPDCHTLQKFIRI